MQQRPGTKEGVKDSTRAEPVTGGSALAESRSRKANIDRRSTNLRPLSEKDGFMKGEARLGEEGVPPHLTLEMIERYIKAFFTVYCLLGPTGFHMPFFFLLFFAFLVFLLPPLSAQTNVPPAHPVPLTYEQRAAQIDAFYAKLPSRFPAGTVELFKQPYEADTSFHGIYPDSNQMLDLAVPPGNGPFPVVIWIHGGGWHSGAREGAMGDCVPYLQNGFAYASIGYRWVQDAPFPAQIEDCNDAIGWLRAHAATYHLDPNAIGVMGHSAGAHLCALLAATGGGTTFKNPQPVQAAVCFSGVYDLDRDRGQWPHSMFLWNPHDPMFPFFPQRVYDSTFAQYASPQSYIHPGMPPILIFVGDQDKSVPVGQAQVFADDLKKAGVDVTFELEAGKDHGSVVSAETRAQTLAFFQQKLRPH